MKTRGAFTLIELLVAVAIIGVVGGYGLASYVRLENRQKVEHQAKEIISFIRMAQMYARNGERGTSGLCNASASVIAHGDNKLIGWKTVFGTNNVTIFPVCNVSGTQTDGQKTELGTFRSNLSLYCCNINASGCSACSNSHFIFTEAIFGNTAYDSDAYQSTSKNATFKVVDRSTGFAYRFDLVNGSVTNGKMCDNSSCNGLSDNY